MTELATVLRALDSLAATYLSGDYTIELKLWTDGDYQVEAFHTVEVNGPTAERERIAYRDGEYRLETLTEPLVGPSTFNSRIVLPTPSTILGETEAR